METQSVTIFVAVVVPAKLPAMHVFVICVAVSAQAAVVPVHAAAPVLNVAIALKLLGLIIL